MFSSREALLGRAGLNVIIAATEHADFTILRWKWHRIVPGCPRFEPSGLKFVVWRPPRGVYVSA